MKRPVVTVLLAMATLGLPPPGSVAAGARAVTLIGNAMLIHPSDNVAAATRLLKSRDGGQSWSTVRVPGSVSQ
jgi:hypothetical protein